MSDKPYEKREIDTKFDYITEKLESIHNSMKDHNEDMTKRVGSLEEWRSNLTGKIAIIAVIFAALWAGFTAWIAKHFF